MRAVTITFVVEDRDAGDMLTWANACRDEGGLSLEGNRPAVLMAIHERGATEAEAGIYASVQCDNLEPAG